MAAVAGTAAAADPVVTSSAINSKKAKKISRKQANKQIAKRAPGLSVASAEALGELEYRRSDVVSVPAGQEGTAHARCPDGKFATGGGGLYPGANNVRIVRSNPSNGTDNTAGYDGWEFRIRNGFTFPRNIRAYVICATALDATGNYSPGDGAL